MSGSWVWGGSDVALIAMNEVELHRRHPSRSHHAVHSHAQSPPLSVDLTTYATRHMWQLCLPTNAATSLCWGRKTCYYLHLYPSHYLNLFILVAAFVGGWQERQQEAGVMNDIVNSQAFNFLDELVRASSSLQQHAGLLRRVSSWFLRSAEATYGVTGGSLSPFRGAPPTNSTLLPPSTTHA